MTKHFYDWAYTAHWRDQKSLARQVRKCNMNEPASMIQALCFTFHAMFPVQRRQQWLSRDTAVNRPRADQFLRRNDRSSLNSAFVTLDSTEIRLGPLKRRDKHRAVTSRRCVMAVIQKWRLWSRDASDVTSVTSGQNPHETSQALKDELWLVRTTLRSICNV